MKGIANQLVSNDLLHHIIEGVPIRIFWKDREGRYLGCNTPFAEDAGFSRPGELIGKTDFDMGWQAQAELYRTDDQHVMDSGEAILTYEEPQTAPDGSTRWLRTSKVPLRNGEQEVIGILGIYEDITEQKTSAEALHLTQFVSDHAPESIIWIDREARIRYANEALCRELGYSREALLEMSVSDIDPLFSAEGWPGHWQDLSRKGRLFFESVHRRRDGVEFPVEISANFVRFGELEYNVAFSRNIAERKAIEAQLRDSENRFRSLLEQSPLATQIVAPDGHILRVNKAWEHLWGVPFAAMAGYNLLHDKQLEKLGVMAQVRKAFVGESVTIPAVEYNRAATPEVPGASGTIWVRSLVYPVKNEHGELREVVLVQEDMSQRIQAEQALRQAADFQSQLLEQAAEGIALWRPSQHNTFAEFLLWNRRLQEITGYTLEEINRIGWLQAMYPDDARRAAARDRMTRVLEGEINHGTDLNVVTRMGEARTLHISSSPVQGRDGEVWVLAVMQDVTEQKRLEEQLRQSQKMEAVGTLVGGIAHDFNNMLAAIQGNIYLARLQLQEPALLEENLANIERLGERATEMVRQLLTFARKDAVAMRPFSLNDFLNETQRLTRTAVPENIECRADICSDELYVRGDVTQLQQVLMNLLSNAVDAVAAVASPQIQCMLQPFMADTAFLQRHPELQQPQLACITIADNGHGIEEAHLEKIFEPFFTTKEVGKGTGLGLAMLYGAMQTHGGAIEVESRVGVGTTFRLYLPLYEGDIVAEAEEATSKALGQGECILLVDDEASVRHTLGQVLYKMGYQVFEAADGQEALALIRAKEAAIDLVISDVIMPRMGGTELLQAVRRFDARLPFILITGYDKKHVLDCDLRGDACQVINKPFDFQVLSRMMRQALKPAEQGE